MDKFELKQNLKRTNKIIEYAIQQRLGKSYSIKIIVSDENYDNDGLISMMYTLSIEYSDPQWHMEIDEISNELKEQSDVIESIFINSKSTIGRDGLFGPNNGNNGLLGPSVGGLEYNTDVFNVQWVMEYSID